MSHDPDATVPVSQPINSTPSGRNLYPPPAQNPVCVCPNPMAAFLCPYGHMTECHFPMSCREANCAHMDRYEPSDEA